MFSRLRGAVLLRPLDSCFALRLSGTLFAPLSAMNLNDIPNGFHEVVTPVNEHEIHALVANAEAHAPAVVLVHGLGVSGTYFLPLAERLATRYRVYVPDLPGTGRSSTPPAPLDIPGLAGSLSAWSKLGGPGCATYVGNSLGCLTVLDLAVRHAELVDGLVLIGPPDPRVNEWRQLGRAVLDLPNEPAGLWPIGLADYLKFGFVRAWRTLRAALADPLERKLPRVQAPTLVIRGHDPIAPLRWVRWLTRRLPSARMRLLPHATHAAHYSAPGDVAQAIEAFIESGWDRNAGYSLLRTQPHLA